MTALAHARPGDEYVLFCEGVHTLTKIDLLQYKRGQMERRIRTLAERRGVTTLLPYLTVLRRDPALLDEFLDRVTINVSQLWRNPEQWEALAAVVLPDLARTGTIRVWSAGCSYGAEAFTVAALCKEFAPRAKTSIHGTDIDARMIVRAREGRFNTDDARSAPASALQRWFEPDERGWIAKPELKELATFETGDLLRMSLPRAHYDLVLCRNTVIYFTEEVRDELHARIAASIRPGGWFVVGATERVAKPQELGFELLRPFTYRKAG
ncbi:MAG: CheR family methyltransferase [Gaiellaceae bacterium]